jgi:hypothetical protein
VAILLPATTDGGSSGSAGAGDPDRPGQTGPAGGPRAGADDGGFLAAPRAAVSAIVRSVEAQVRATVKPEAVAAVATTFSFPLLLMLVVLVFLLIQDRLDGRDPKLRNAPLTAAETTVAFTDEDQR